MARKATNKLLHKAKKSKSDEFYTQLCDIESELKFYKTHFKDRVVYCGNETYAKIHEYSGFNLAQWITENISWSEDLSRETHAYFEENDLTRYLTW